MHVTAPRHDGELSFAIEWPTHLRVMVAMGLSVAAGIAGVGIGVASALVVADFVPSMWGCGAAGFACGLVGAVATRRPGSVTISDETLILAPPLGRRTTIPLRDIDTCRREGAAVIIAGVGGRGFSSASWSLTRWSSRSSRG